jgi:hypothetical protein
VIAFVVIIYQIQHIKNEIAIYFNLSGPWMLGREIPLPVDIMYGNPESNKEIPSSQYVEVGGRSKRRKMVVQS